MITRFDRSDAFADLHYDACAFMAENAGKKTFGVVARERKCVGMADPRMRDPDQYFARPGWCNVDLDYFQWLARTECNSST